jgi:osmotically-inducible protein OsmY
MERNTDMKTAGMQRTDHEILQAVRDELDWTPDVDAARIGVAVDHGGVTLTGEVPSYTERVAATRAALRVHGVLALADELIVNPPAAGILTDSTVAQAIEHAFEYAVTLPSTVKATVRHGRVTLTGTADWNYERAQARRLVRGIKGVRDVLDLIELTRAHRRMPHRNESTRPCFATRPWTRRASTSPPREPG